MSRSQAAEFNGWLCPNGRFIPCPIQGHSKVAVTLKPDRRGGYIHVHPTGVFADVRPTARQRSWLEGSLQVARNETYIDMVKLLLEKW